MINKIGIYIGRFQPFHNGHLSVVQQMSKEMDQSYIIIGSTDKHEENPNPLTYCQRSKMIELVLRGKGLNNVKVGGGTYDYESDKKWLSSVFMVAGSAIGRDFEEWKHEQMYVYTRNPVVEALMKDAEIKVRKPKAFPLENGKILSATHIRECIKYDRDEWITMVPCEVQDYLYECHGIATIKRCS